MTVELHFFSYHFYFILCASVDTELFKAFPTYHSHSNPFLLPDLGSLPCHSLRNYNFNLFLRSSKLASLSSLMPQFWGQYFFYRFPVYITNRIFHVQKLSELMPFFQSGSLALLRGKPHLSCSLYNCSTSKRIALIYSQQLPDFLFNHSTTTMWQAGFRAQGYNSEHDI